jgi:regulator of nonsense transcripts 1
LKRGQFAKMQSLVTLKEEQGELSEKDEKTLKELKQQAEDEIIKGADVICTTCVAAFDRRIRNIKFRQVLIDEAT